MITAYNIITFPEVQTEDKRNYISVNIINIKEYTWDYTVLVGFVVIKSYIFSDITPCSLVALSQVSEEQDSSTLMVK
jgi:hypothetical protein